MTGSGEVPITVSGGAGGVAASYDDLRTLALLYELLGGELSEAARRDSLEAVDGDLLASAVLSPVTFAEAESEILAATYGPRGLVSRAVLVEAHAFAFTAVVDLYRTADVAQRAAYEALGYGLGVTVGLQLLPVTLTAGVARIVVAQVDPGLAARLDHGVVALLEANPEVVQAVANGSGGVLDGLGLHPVSGPFLRALGIEGPHLTTGSAAADLGDLLFADRSGTAVPVDHAVQYAAPRGLADLVGDLATTAGAGEGAVTLQRLSGEGGDRWVVHLPGTDAFADLGSVRDMGTNLRLVAGDDTAYGQAVEQAMATAGVRPTDPVLLVGHSQGGMQAAALAGDPDFAYSVTHVVTAGAPVATTDVPDHVGVVSLENAADLVPSLDGEPNRDAASHTTVHADVRTGSLGAGTGNHGLALYAAVARAADASADPSVRSALSEMREAGFLGASSTQTFAFRAEVEECAGVDDIGTGDVIENAA